MVRINLDANTAATDRGLAFIVHEFGLLREGANDCADLGNEFNPLL
eukprot:CAMPEP_0185566682 /NCGR_PEP_ID=MMETSP0434-20130131/59_1 /TAXON_ID=626734 ORGANISM="Favella taraikaensis, Strain Fe Narragansett Bay" /NCGR_SAMPLE_ID=MMETSP0434 /ASSEMBLY_ACC=CAM_ASM_000379 /LENGTH=45 /DNA_ID= /DNA_START= /DNA_END= /DNA_ORIENTATION=